MRHVLIFLTLNFSLYLLKSHCEARGFGVVMAFECIILEISRVSEKRLEDYDFPCCGWDMLTLLAVSLKEELGDKFRQEAQEGRLIVLGSTRLGAGNNVWAFPVVLAGETQENVKELSERILKYEMGKGDEQNQELEEAGA